MKIGLDEYLTILNPFFHNIRDKNVLEYGCYIGDWWKMFDLHSPKSVTAFDPRRESGLDDNLNSYRHFVDYKQTGYEILENDIDYDIVVCAGLLYKMSSPFHLIEDVANRNAECIFFETVGQLEDQSVDIGLIRNENNEGNRNTNRNIKRLPWVVSVPPRTVVDAFALLGYKLDDYINIKCESRPSKEAVAMMRFIKQ